VDERILTLDIGSSTLTLAEFAAIGEGELQLLSYSTTDLGLEPGSDADPSAYVVSAIREVMRENNIRPGNVLVSVPGKDIFPRCVKLPPVTRDKIDQIVKYEAQQNVPFGIEEVVWDYQLMQGGGGQSVMLVAIKTEIVQKLADCVRAAELDPEIVDVAPMALYNLVRYNYGEMDGCTLVMDIGARTTNLVFIEETKAFCRSIPIAGNTITQELMKEFEVPFADAEELKLAHAFVAFGGAVEGAENQVVNRVSKTVRGVMTRLHSEVSRSINFYRSQQSGSRPSRVLLCGGSSVIRETDTFLNEKLGIEVLYLNPCEKVTVSDEISTDEITTHIHRLGEVTGLALRRVFSCPMEINLIPPELKARRTLRARLPFFGIAAVGVLAIMLCWWGYFARLRSVREANLRTVQERVSRADRLVELIEYRTTWSRMLEGIHTNLVDGMWLTSVEPVPAEGLPIRTIKITGLGFTDKVLDPSAVGEIREPLKNSSLFEGNIESVEVERARPSAQHSIEFTILIHLKEPLEF
jgi:type IV pilus assembly protein PilM